MIINPFIALLDLGGTQVLVILGAILLLFGAKKLPELARSLGQAKKEFTKATREASEEIEKLTETDSQKKDGKKDDKNSSKLNS